MRKMIFLLLALISSQARAASLDIEVKKIENHVETIQVKVQGTIEYQILFEVIGKEGQTIDEFAAQISPLLREWSDETHFEACGVIATDGKKYGIQIGSAKSHIGCTNFHDLTPEGMTSTNKTIHSHGTDQKFQVSEVDTKLMGETYGGGSYGKNTRRNFQFMSGQDLSTFSDADFSGGEGYLAIPNGGLLYQEGKRKIKKVR